MSATQWSVVGTASDREPSVHLSLRRRRVPASFQGFNVKMLEMFQDYWTRRPFCLKNLPSSEQHETEQLHR